MSFDKAHISLMIQGETHLGVLWKFISKYKDSRFSKDKNEHIQF